MEQRGRLLEGCTARDERSCAQLGASGRASGAGQSRFPLLPLSLLRLAPSGTQHLLLLQMDQLPNETVLRIAGAPLP